MAKWIRFVSRGIAPGRKTAQWSVVANQGGDLLGNVQWDTGWRRYIFAPAEMTSFEQDCLRDIAAFIEDETRKHKAEAVPHA